MMPLQERPSYANDHAYPRRDLRGDDRYIGDSPLWHRRDSAVQFRRRHGRQQRVPVQSHDPISRDRRRTTALRGIRDMASNLVIAMWRLRVVLLVLVVAVTMTAGLETMLYLRAIQAADAVGRKSHLVFDKSQRAHRRRRSADVIADAYRYYKEEDKPPAYVRMDDDLGARDAIYAGDVGSFSEDGVPVLPSYGEDLSISERIVARRERRTFLHSVSEEEYQKQFPLVRPRIDQVGTRRDHLSNIKESDVGRRNSGDGEWWSAQMAAMTWFSASWPRSRALNTTRREGLHLISMLESRTARCNHAVHFGGQREHGHGEQAVCVDMWVGFGMHGGYGRDSGIEDTDVAMIGLEKGDRTGQLVVDGAAGHAASGGEHERDVFGEDPLPVPCLVYSFGVGTDFSFDDAMAASGCDVHSFDPSAGVKDHARHSRIVFHNVGLAAVNSDHIQATKNGRVLPKEKPWQVRKLPRLIKHCKHLGQVISVLRLDLGGDEWAILASLVDGGPSGVLAQFVAQLVVEVHLWNSYPFSKESPLWPTAAVVKAHGYVLGQHYYEPNALFHRGRANVLRGLYDLGFDLVWSVVDPRSSPIHNFFGPRMSQWDTSTDLPCCYSLTFVNRHLRGRYMHPRFPRWIQHAHSQVII